MVIKKLKRAKNKTQKKLNRELKREQSFRGPIFLGLDKFLALTGALEEGILYVRASVCEIIQINSENEF